MNEEFGIYTIAVCEGETMVDRMSSATPMAVQCHAVHWLWHTVARRSTLWCAVLAPELFATGDSRPGRHHRLDQLRGRSSVGKSASMAWLMRFA